MTTLYRARRRPVAVDELSITASKTHTPGIDPSLMLKVIYRPVGELRPSPRNARTHSKKQIHKIKASLRQFGFTNPILVRPDSEIVAGHGRFEAAKDLGYKAVPTICLEHLSEADLRAYRIADNKLAELAGWDEEFLKIEFAYLAEIDMDLPEITGFETPEIDLILNSSVAPVTKSDPADDVRLLPRLP
jgi:ParB-like chromosome segregation protein Spo0J